MEILNNSIFKLSSKSIIILFIFYLSIMLVGMFFCVVGMLHEYTFISTYPILLKAMVGCAGSTLLGSSIFYSRKLYKSIISRNISTLSNEEHNYNPLGIFMYFLLRPFFSIAFALLLILAIRVSVLIVSVKETIFDEGFIYFCMFLSFFVGFSSGDVLSLLEDMGKNKIEKFFKIPD